MANKSLLAAQPLMTFVPTTDPDRAKVFYRDTLGLKLIDEELPFALVFDVNGTILRVTIVSKLAPASFTVLGWRVTDIDAAVDSLQEAGVVFQRYEKMKQDARGIWTAPGGGKKVAWFKDPDGNVLSLAQFD